MPMNPAKFVPFEMKTSLLKVLDYREKNITGILQNPYFPQDMYCENTVKLIFLISDMLDDLNFPQQSTYSRSFSKQTGSQAKDPPGTKAPDPGGRALASFKISVIFRQNASWQGNLVWVEEQMESPFRSVLELLTLIDSVMTQRSA